jgi:hypothetical protein
MIKSGDPPKDETFETPRAYKITWPIHPGMNLTVVVQ